MRKRETITIHGHTLVTIERLLNNAVEMVSRPVHLETVMSGGWSNINILARAGSRRLIIKLPGLRTNCISRTYDGLFANTLVLSEKNICPRPIELGSLDDIYRTPFFILEYEEGHIPDKIEYLSREELASISAVLAHLRGCRLPHVETYQHPSEYLKTLLAGLDARTRHLQRSERVEDYVQQLMQDCVGLGAYLDSNCDWSRQSLVHGDLQESNILLLSHGEARLLDLEACFMGDPAFDLAYLVCQRAGEWSESDSLLPDLIRKEESTRVRLQIPLALVSVIAWSIEYLHWSEQGCVEPVIKRSHSQRDVIDYIEHKIRQLERFSENWYLA